MNWISVEDRLPGMETGQCIVIARGGVICAAWAQGRFYHLEEWRGTHEILEGVTYWMPLPELTYE